MARLPSHHWYNQQFVAKSGRFLWKAFGTGIGVIQGNPASLVIFNIVVDALVRVVLAKVCGSQEAQHGLGWSTREWNLVLYTDD